MKRLSPTFFVVLLLLSASLFSAQDVLAAQLYSISHTFSTLKISGAASSSIAFTTPTGATDSTDTIIITFPASYNFTSKAISSVTFTHGTTTNAELTETLAASPSATAWGAAFSGTQNRVFTLTAPTDGTGVNASRLEAAHKVKITFDDTNSANPSSSGTYRGTITGTFGDTGTTTVVILDDDQVAISAYVEQSLTFTISDSSIGFGTLSASAAQYATGDTSGSTSETEAHTVVVGTNALNGYTLSVGGSTLTHSASAGTTISAIGGTNTASSAGSEQFGFRATASGGSGSVSSPYAASGFAFTVGTTTLATASGASANTTYSLRYLANIASNTEAGTYNTSLTYAATGNF